MSAVVANQLASHLHTELSIGRINMGLLNRIIIEDLYVEDQHQAELLKVARLSARFDIWALLKGKISINSVQLFGFDLKLTKENSNDELNLQFIIDTFKSPEKQKETTLDLRINSLLIRRGKLSYHIESEQKKEQNTWDTNHLEFDNIIANISLKALRNDSINAQVKRLSFKEQSGLELNKLSLKVVGNQERMKIDNLEVALPHTTLAINSMDLAYDGVSSFNEFADKVEFSLNTRPSYLTLADFSAFVPIFNNFTEKIDLAIDVEGTVNQLNCRRIAINADKHIQILGNGTIDNLSQLDDALLYANLSKLTISPEGVDFLLRNFSENYRGVPPILQRLGTLGFKGELSGYFSDIVTYGLFTTDLGNIRTDVKFSSTNELGRFDYNGSIETKNFQLGKLTNNEDLNEVSLNVKVEGQKLEARSYPNLLVQGEIQKVDFKEYSYNNILIDGDYKEGGFDGELSLNDTNGALSLRGSFNLAKATPTFNFEADINEVRPYQLNLNKRDENAVFSVGVTANFTGATLDEMNGEININDLVYLDSELDYKLDNFKIKAVHTESENQLLIDSKFLKAKIDGHYSYQTVWSSFLETAQHYIPSLSIPKKSSAIKKNDFHFRIDLIDTEILTQLFNFPLQTYTHSTLNGFFNDQEHKLHIEGHFPKLRYKNHFFESAMFLLENPNEELTAHVRLSKQKQIGAVNIALNAVAHSDSISTSLHWGNNGEITYSGQFNMQTIFSRLKDELNRSQLQTEINILPSNVILNDTTWRVHPAHIVVNKKEVTVDNFKFTNNKQFIYINGKVSASPKDTLSLDLNDIDLGYLFEVVDFDAVDFKGKATGYAILSQLYSKPEMDAKLHVNNFTFNNGNLGDMDIYSFWDNENEGIFLDADMNQDDVGFTKVTGFVYPLDPKNGLDLKIAANGTNIAFLDYYMEGVASNCNGRAYGDVRLSGKFSDLNLEGSLLADASLKIDVLNTDFTLKDSLTFSTTGIEFKDIAISDVAEHQGTLNGKLSYQSFRDLKYYFNIDAYNLLVMDTKEDPDFPFYGTIYATGKTVITGDYRGLTVDAAVTTNRNTQFTYITNATATAASSQFIQFNDLSPRRVYKDTLQLSMEEYMVKHNKEQEYEEESDIRLNLQIDATPDATIKIILDPLSGDYITANGSGNIRTSFYNKGDIEMFGSYEISRGVYKFSLQEVIRKDFSIRDGSNITFNGSPVDGNLNIRAQHTVNSVSLSDLIPSESLLTSQPHIKVNCLLDLTGPIARPNISFALDLPNERDEIQALVKNYISTEEQLNMQVLYLLGIGKFYTADNTNAQSSDMMSSVLSSTLSGQLNDLLSQFTNNSNWSFGTNLSTGYKGWTDVEVEGILSAQLLNNRLLINGNFGYRDNPMSTTNFVGDFEAEWLLNRSGNIRLRAYSRTNDKYLSRTNLTTQGIGIMFRKDYMNWRELLWWNTIRERRRLRQIEKKKQEQHIQQQAEEEKAKELKPIE